jgi:hypothetical protein
MFLGDTQCTLYKLEIRKVVRDFVPNTYFKSGIVEAQPAIAYGFFLSSMPALKVC